jgi:hypothetical protein
MVQWCAMDLPEQAARALAAVRQRSRAVHFEIKRACEQERWRLKVCYLAADAAGGKEREEQLGLLWSDDLDSLDDLRRRLESGG